MLLDAFARHYSERARLKNVHTSREHTTDIWSLYKKAPAEQHTITLMILMRVCVMLCCAEDDIDECFSFSLSPQYASLPMRLPSRCIMC